MWIQKVPGGAVLDLAYAPDGRTLYTVDRGGNLTAWDVSKHTKKPIVRDERLNSSYTRIVPLADGRRLVALSSPLSGEPWFSVWDVIDQEDVTDGSPPDTFDWLGGVVRPDGRVFGISQSQFDIAGWNSTTGKAEPGRRTHGPRITAFDLAADGRSVAVAFERGCATVFEWGVSAALKNPVEGPEVGLDCAVRFAPDGRTLAVAVSVNYPSLTLWDTKTSAHELTVACRLDRRFAFNPALPVLVGIGEEDVLTLYSRDTGDPIRALDFALGKHVQCIAFSPDGLTCAVGGSNKQFAVFDVDV